jgi:hypothetical protein
MAFSIPKTDVTVWLQTEFPNLKTEQHKVTSLYSTDGRVKHMARQLGANTWTSKLGQAWDIEHKTPQGVEGETYGRAVQYLKRPGGEK